MDVKEKVNELIHGDSDSQITQQHDCAQAFVPAGPFIRLLHMRNSQYSSHDFLL